MLRKQFVVHDSAGAVDADTVARERVKVIEDVVFHQVVRLDIGSDECIRLYDFGM